MLGRTFAGIVALLGPGLITAQALTSQALAAQAGGTQEKVYRNISSDHLEKILKALNIDFKKTTGKQEGISFYDFERSGRKMRVHNYQGEDLWIDTFFNDKTTLEKVNGWNTRAKFSRAVLVQTDETTNISLECQLDCQGGVTDGMLRQFIHRFDKEADAFAKYLAK